MKMKSMIFVLSFIVIAFTLMATRPFEVSETKVIMDKTVKMAVTGTTATGDTVLFASDPFSTEGDTLVFILETYYSDKNTSSSTVTYTFHATTPVTALYKSVDSLEIWGAVEGLTPQGMPVKDTGSFVSMLDSYTAFKKYSLTGRTAYGSPVVLPAGINSARLWVRVVNKAATTTTAGTTAKFRVYRVRN